MSRPLRTGSPPAVSLCGLPVRAENVRLLASRLDGDNLAQKLERALANGNVIVALSVEERQRIVDVLERTPASLAHVRMALDAQLRKHKEREGRIERTNRDRAVIDQQRAARREP